MPPRGRPPGRKSSVSSRSQPRDGKQQTPKRAIRGGRKSNGVNRETSPAQEIHVASPSKEDAATPGIDKPATARPASPDLKTATDSVAGNNVTPVGREVSPAIDEDSLSESGSPRLDSTPAPVVQQQQQQPPPPPPPPPPPSAAAVAGVNGISSERATSGSASRAHGSQGPGVAGALAPGSGAGKALPIRVPLPSYGAPGIDLDAISHRQFGEDIAAYVVDMDFCNSQLSLPSLTPQETRTLQLRRLDLGHQIRFSQHRREMLEAQRLLKGERPLGLGPAAAGRPGPLSRGGGGGGGSASLPRAHADRNVGAPRGRPPKRMLSLAADEEEEPLTDSRGTPASYKRARATSEASGPDTISVSSGADEGGKTGGGYAYAADDEEGDTTTATATTPGHEGATQLQRLGFWKCRLCLSEKYLLAGAGRQPSAPSKWPLKDMGKLMSHYFDMHTEHDPDERCAELGDALDRNRGPFEYWLRKSRAQRIPDSQAVIDQVVRELQAGRVPKMLRDLCRAAAAFPGA